MLTQRGIGMSERENGHVKWFNEKKGFGFIVNSNSGDDIFVHYKDINASGFKTLDVDAKVSFVLETGPKGLKAQDVVVIASE